VSIRKLQPIARELKEISKIIDANPGVLDLFITQPANLDKDTEFRP